MERKVKNGIYKKIGCLNISKMKMALNILERCKYYFAFIIIRNGQFREGRGAMITPEPNKQLYEGWFKQNMFHGRGRVIFQTGAYYIGEWSEGNKHGQGYMWLQNGQTYQGEYRDDMKNGQGTYRWPSGDIYIGEWLDGKKHGKGFQ